MLEIAIISTKCALRDVHPEFMEFYNERSWGELIVEEDKKKKNDEDEEPSANDEQMSAEQNLSADQCSEAGADAPVPDTAAQTAPELTPEAAHEDISSESFKEGTEA